jgi:riboflavin kinase/FMN adenylyltransferase
MTAPAKPAVVTIGNFDGVHLGHRKLLGSAVERARALGQCSLAITFDPHPEQVLFPDRQFSFLSSPEERTDYLRETGIDDVWVMAFTRELAKLEPAEFMQLVAERQPLSELWVGSDFALGRGRQGTIAVLSELGGAHGWSLHVVPPYRLNGQIVSSTAIRTLLAAGAVRGAADLLGRPYSVRGGLSGHALQIDPNRALPRPGRYSGDLVWSPDGSASIQAEVAAESPTIVLSDAPTASDHAELRFLRRAD